jgi:NADPH:quinone reductase-like Zn-dependent oxidoreductase
MKAARIHRLGGPEVISIDEVPDPVPGPGQVLVRVHAAAVNPADWKGREGFYEDADWYRLPHIPGRDFSGVIAAAHPDIEEFDVGDAVFGVTDQGQEGAYAELLVMNPAIIAPKPRNLSHAESAAICLGTLTAMVSIEDTAQLKKGETILIHGGAGGVGAMAVQLARRIGARIIATARGANADYVRSLGAETVIDYTKDEIAAIGPVCDVVFDTVGGKDQPKLCSVIKPGGRLAWISRGPKDFKAPDHVTVLRPDVKRDRHHLNRIAALAEAGEIKAPAVTTFPLAQAADAQEAHKHRKVAGKVVVVME